MILTAGYGNRGFAPFIELMKQHGVTHLVDVRSVPQSSYWVDFRRERLAEIVPPTGLKYIYMGDTLGGVPNSPVLCKDPAAVDIHPLFHDPTFRLGLRKLIEASSVEGRVICLMCGCLRPHKCHRSRLIAEALVSEGVEVFHLDEKGQPVRHAVVVEESTDPQAALF